MRIPDAIEHHLTADERRHVMQRLWSYLRPQRRRVVLASVLVVLQAACMLAGPALVRYGIDHGVRARDPGVLTKATVMFIVTAVGAYVFGRAVIMTVTRAGEILLRQLRETVFAHQLSLSMEFYDRHRTGDLVARMTADVEALEELVGQGLTMFIVNALLFSGAVLAMSLMSWQLALGTLVVVPMVAYASVWFRRESNRAYLTLRDRIGMTMASLQEGLSGIRVVQAFSQEPTVLERFSETNELQFRAQLKTERIAAIYFPVIELAQGTAVAVILGLGGYLSARGVVTVGTVAAFVLYLQNLFEPVQQLSQLFNTLQAAGAALHKLFVLLDEKPAISERPGAVDLPDSGAIDVRDVSFTYAGTDEPVLSDVTLSVSPGQRLALVGPTGAGKSTLAKLMVRFYDPSAGQVRYAGVDLRDAGLASLRACIVVVPQEGFLFEGTIRDNLAIGRPAASDDEMWKAVADLGLTSRFEAFDGGLDAVVREQGSNMSAGERQLVSIVRAALADPSVVVLDEATSSLDPGTEVTVEAALEKLLEGRTVVLIAHRLSTAARADRVAVVDGGRVVEQGTHAQLIEQEGPYASLFASWMGRVI
ncbi:MAG TPA: ABC transporter ATP-binding protein [Acidimicrobiales bacterium]|nr:ABC transporter ATP-binding protein [Acidimicrobiales bacterium]